MDEKQIMIIKPKYDNQLLQNGFQNNIQTHIRILFRTYSEIRITTNHFHEGSCSTGHGFKIKLAASCEPKY